MISKNSKITTINRVSGLYESLQLHKRVCKDTEIIGILEVLSYEFELTLERLYELETN